MTSASTSFNVAAPYNEAISQSNKIRKTRDTIVIHVREYYLRLAAFLHAALDVALRNGSYQGQCFLMLACDGHSSICNPRYHEHSGMAKVPPDSGIKAHVSELL